MLLALLLGAGLVGLGAWLLGRKKPEGEAGTAVAAQQEAQTGQRKAEDARQDAEAVAARTEEQATLEGATDDDFDAKVDAVADALHPAAGSRAGPGAD